MAHESVKEAKKTSRKERKRRERKERRRRASVDSPAQYGSVGDTQQQRHHRPQAAPKSDTVSALFAYHGVRVNNDRAGGLAKSGDAIRSPFFEPPQLGWTATSTGKPHSKTTPAQSLPQPLPPIVTPAPSAPSATSAVHPADPESGSAGSNPMVRDEQQGTMRTSASAPSGLSALRPAGLSLVASATSAPTSELVQNDDTITPRTRRIGNFARRQAGAGGYAAAASAAPVRLLPQATRK